MVPFVVESWIWFSCVMLIALSRFISRYMALGKSLKHFQADEYVMLVVLCFYTTLIVTINLVANSSSNLLPPGYDTSHITAEDRRQRVYGSKLVLVVEESQCVTIWGAKACLLIMYLRLTTMRKENIAIKVLAGYVAGTFVLMEILYLGVWCRPFSNYWALPTPNPQCDAATNHLITNAVFNLTSDIAMLAIGLPMFLRLTMPWTKKVPLIGIFSLGVFVIVAAIMNKVYSFGSPFGSEWVYWYVRESSTALIVANLPFIWLLYRKLFGISGTGDTRMGSLHHTISMGTARGRRATVDPIEGRKMSDGTDHDLEGTNPLDRMRTLSGSMTFEEMLRVERVVSFSEKPATPYTHPALFYGSGARKNTRAENPLEHAILRDSLEQDTVRRGSEAEHQYARTPASSQATGSQKSPSSFA
nr:hypothetical protein B0A51_05410 [Rachicladosporium sp. CCFEE 5018]